MNSEMQTDSRIEQIIARRLQAVIETVGEGITLSNGNGHFEIFNSKMEEITGYSREEVNHLGDFLRLLYPDVSEYQRALTGIQEIAQTGGSRDVETTIRTKDGTVKTLLVSSVMMQYQDHDWFLSVYRDITEHKQADEALVKERNLLRTIINNLPDYIYVKDTESRLLLANDATARVMGAAAPDEVVGKTDFDFYPVEIARQFYAGDRTVLEQGRPLLNREELLIDQQTHVSSWILTTKVPFRDNQGNIAGLVGIGHDITERRRAEQEREQLIALIEHSFDFIAMASLDGQLSYVNPAGQRLVGLKSVEEARNTRMLDYVPEEERKRLRRAVVTIMRDGFWYGESYVKNLNTGEHVPVAVNAFLIKAQETDKPVALAMVAHDLTRRKRAEEERRRLEVQLRQAQKMEAIGTLAGGIAHDFNNILSTMMGYTDLLLNKHPEPGTERTYLEEIDQAGERATDLVRQLLTFSRIEEYGRKPLQVTPLVKEGLKLVRATLSPAIEIRQRLDPECHPLLANATQIHQVIVNLCTNAGHAMKDTGGILEVSLEEVQDISKYIPAPDLQEERGYLKLTVTDTGCGMDPEVKERIFDPFFTTKEIGEGTGLGLSVVHGIVKNHKGAITVESEPGKGTTFHLFFPVFEGDVQEETGKESPVRKGTEHILIVEDEVALAKYYAISLEQLGYRVTVANDSSEALEIFRTHPDQFDVVFTDQAMPKMTGAQLSWELRRIRSDIPIILTTGYSNAISEERARTLGIRYFLMKPVKMNTLTQMIRECLM